MYQQLPVYLIIWCVTGIILLSWSDQDYPNCDKKSVSSIVKNGTNYARKVFLGCAFRFGEIAKFINKRSGEDVTIKCVSKNESLSGDLIESGSMFVLDVFKEPLESLDWKCTINDTYNQKITLKPFDNYKSHQSFNYQLNDAGIYDMSPRLVSMWS